MSDRARRARDASTPAARGSKYQALTSRDVGDRSSVTAVPFSRRRGS
jgi:hypothetical protein